MKVLTYIYLIVVCLICSFIVSSAYATATLLYSVESVDVKVCNPVVKTVKKECVQVYNATILSNVESCNIEKDYSYSEMECSVSKSSINNKVVGVTIDNKDYVGYDIVDLKTETAYKLAIPQPYFRTAPCTVFEQSIKIPVSKTSCAIRCFGISKCQMYCDKVSYKSYCEKYTFQSIVYP